MKRDRLRPLRDEWSTRVLRAFALTLGVTMVCLLGETYPLTASRRLTLYHFDGSAADLFLPVLVNVIVLWTLLAGLMLWARAGRLRATIWTGMVLVVPCVMVKEESIAQQWSLAHWASLSLAVIPIAAVAAVNLMWGLGLSARLKRLFPLCEGVLYSLSLGGLVVLAQLLYCFVLACGLNDAPRLHLAAVGGIARPAGEPRRVIVILFDELSFEQTYGHRSPEVELPAFDRLAAEATVLRNVRPAAELTDRAIPSLLTGQTVTDIRPSPNERELMMEGTQGWTRLDAENTVFSDALKAGYETGLAGWYNPYCRIFGEVLDRCTWHAHASLPKRMVADKPMAGRVLLQNSLEPLRGLLGMVPGFLNPKVRRREPDTELTKRHIRDYEQISSDADSLLRDPRMTFVFLHLPIPHQGGIYDRRRGTMTVRSTSYLDNLALADRYLAHARALLEENGDWDDSVVVVLGDHSWRTWLWSESLFWTEEDRALTAGKGFDDRPAMVVKLAGGGPGGKDGAHIDAAFEAKRTRWMLDELMMGRIRTEAELARWVEEQAR